MGYDAIVIGLGGVGSAAAAHLAAQGLRVLGLEQHSPVHALGSSHGRSRIIRQAYMEGTAYVPLAQRAYELWRRLERATGMPLLRITGGLMIGDEDSRVVTGSRRSAHQFGIEHEMLDADELSRRFPVLRPERRTVALYENGAGVLSPESCVHAHLQSAVTAGAELRFGARVDGWEGGGTGCLVSTRDGEIAAERLVITAGPWAPRLLGALGRSLEVTREIMYWFSPAGGTAPFEPGRFPIWMWESADGSVIYGFPALDGPAGGVKVARHHAGRASDPDAVDREVAPEEIEEIRQALEPIIPDLAGEPMDAVTCLYTNTPDEHFLVGRHPEQERVVLAAGLSGHGFKFASALGEALAEMTTEGRSRIDLAPFAPGKGS